MASIKYLINALLVAVSISVVSWANDFVFAYATIAAGGLVGLFLVVTILFAFEHKKRKLTNCEFRTEGA